MIKLLYNWIDKRNINSRKKNPIEEEFVKEKIGEVNQKDRAFIARVLQRNKLRINSSKSKPLNWCDHNLIIKITNDWHCTECKDKI